MDMMIELNEAELRAVAGGVFAFSNTSTFSATGPGGGEAHLTRNVTVSPTSFNDTSTFTGSLVGGGTT